MTTNIFYSKNLTKKFDNKLVFKSFLLLFILVIPFQIIHETGHAIPCYFEGKEFKMNISILGSSLNCLGDVENKSLFRASGGLLALLVSFIPYVILRKQLTNYPFISIVLLSMALAQLANMGIETILYNDYISNGLVSMISISTVQYGSFIYFVYHFSKKGIKK